MQPKISVIIPIYKAEQYLRRCVDSVLNQDFKEIEVLLVVSDSGDACVDICKEYCKTDNRAKVVVMPPKGLSAARNAGLDIAAGEYVSFVDSDDYILPGMYSRMYEYVSKNRLDIGICSAYRSHGEKSLEEYWVSSHQKLLIRPDAGLKDFILTWNITGRNAPVWNKLYRRAFIESLTLRFQIGVISEDSIFNCTCFSRADAVGAVNDAFYVYTDNSESLFYAVSKVKLEEYLQAYWKILLANTDGDAQQSEILAFAAVRLAAACIYLLKAMRCPIDELCEYTCAVIKKLGFAPYLRLAQEPELFAIFAGISGLRESEAENYLGFIHSLNGGYEAIRKRQALYYNELRQVK